MERHGIAPRENWQQAVEELGLIWHGEADDLYWDERAYYAFTAEEIDRIETATETVYTLFLEAGERIIAEPELMELFGIPEYCHKAVKAAWRDEPPALNYGRFDFGYNGEGEPKLWATDCPLEEEDEEQECVEEEECSIEEEAAQ